MSEYRCTQCKQIITSLLIDVKDSHLEAQIRSIHGDEIPQNAEVHKLH